MQAVAARAMLAWLVQETLNSKLSTLHCFSFYNEKQNPPCFLSVFLTRRQAQQSPDYFFGYIRKKQYLCSQGHKTTNKYENRYHSSYGQGAETASGGL
jgi:hypothetical protein